MKTIGLIGGMSWESSAVYYKILNERVREELGKLNSCQCIMSSVNFADIEPHMVKNEWKTVGEKMACEAQKLENAGADVIVLCTNTIHLVSKQITDAISIPFIHIAEASGEAIAEKGLKKVALLGTRFTMEKDFYKNILKEKFDIETIIPNSDDMNLIHEIIFKELVIGEIKISSRQAYKRIIYKLEKQGAEGVILGCTEIPMLISDKDVTIPTFDTTKIHAEKALKFALS